MNYLYVFALGFFLDVFYTIWTRAANKGQVVKACIMAGLLSTCSLMAAAIAANDFENIWIHAAVWSVSQMLGTYVGMKGDK